MKFCCYEIRFHATNDKIMYERLPLSAGQVDAASGAQGTVCHFYSISSKAHNTVGKT